jgi:putative addiction module killer protein
LLRIEIYKLGNGHEPYKEWVEKLPLLIHAKIDVYIRRLASGGTKKNIRSIGEGVFELKLNFGPGYRVYFGIKEEKLIILLCGGDKGAQSRDIKQAKNYWRNYVQK